MDFFKGVDANGSQYPAFYYDVHISELKETIDSEERRLNAGQVPYDLAYKLKASIEKNKKLLEEIERSRPSLSDGERDRINKAYKQLGKEIGQYLFSRSEMMIGLASPHEEARRMTEPCISADGFDELIKACNVQVTDGKVTRNGAAKMFKICGKLIGEPTNIEVLRKDKRTVRTKAA